MALKINFSRLDQLSRDELTALKALNENYTKLEKLLDTLLSRDGLYPNQMQADLDMNHKMIVNVESGPGDNDVVTRKDIRDLIAKTEQAIKDFNTLYEQALKGLDLYNKELIQPDIEELNVKIEQFYNTIGNLVDKTSEQTISGVKTFTGAIKLGPDLTISSDYSGLPELNIGVPDGRGIRITKKGEVYEVTVPNPEIDPSKIGELVDINNQDAASVFWVTRKVNATVSNTVGYIEAVLDAINGTSAISLSTQPLTKSNSPIVVDATTGFTDEQLVHLKSDASEALGQSSIVLEDLDGSKCRVGHYMTGDRYGIQTAIHNDAFEDTQGIETDCIVSQQYVSNVGKVINDFSMSDSFLVPTTSVTSKTNQAASTEHVSQKIQSNVKVHASDPTGTADNGTIWVNTSAGKVYINVGGADTWIMLSGTSYTSN